MLSFFKNNKEKNLRGESYYDRENMVHNINDLLSIFYPDSNNNYTSAETIKFIGLELNEVNEKSIKKVLKEPNFIIDEKVGLNGHKVLFYRQTVNNLIFVMQFHFLKGIFLFVSNTTSSATQLTHSEKESFVKRITDKYIPETVIDFKNGCEMHISDNHNNFLTIVDGVNFRVDYIYNTPQNQQLLKNPNLLIELTEDNFDSKIDDYF